MGKRLGFTYLFCNDLEKMKWFYSEVLYLELIWDLEDSIAYKIGDHQLSITLDKSVQNLSKDFAIQPGWEGGTVPRTGWSLECDKKDFKVIIESILSLEITRYYNKPKWNGYWSFPILDPMNNTIEITCIEKDIN